MNLVSVTVNGASLPASTSLVTTAYQWNQGSLSWQTVAPGANLSSGAVLWLNAQTNGVLTFTGNYADPSSYAVTSGPSFLPSTGLEALTLSNLPSQLTTNNWFYNGQNQSWQISAAIPLTSSSFNITPHVLPPSASLMSRSDSGGPYTPPDPTLRIRYYHTDHLGSTSLLTDEIGNPIEETADYPFGQSRNNFRPRHISENYQFTQKENDPESGLEYFETRYHFGTLGRFNRADSLCWSPPMEWLVHPQKQNVYAYCYNSPIQCVDPTGTDGTSSDSDWSTVTTASHPAVNSLSDYTTTTSDSTVNSLRSQTRQAEDEKAIFWAKMGAGTTFDSLDKGANAVFKSKNLLKQVKKLGIDKDNLKSLGNMGKGLGYGLVALDVGTALMARPEDRVPKLASAGVAYGVSTLTMAVCEVSVRLIGSPLASAAAVVPCAALSGFVSSPAGDLAEHLVKSIQQSGQQSQKSELPFYTGANTRP
jgi:RHS repeat-associated protein